MTADEVSRRVDRIRAIAGDDERAHSEEDDLHQDVLRYFASHDHENGDLAREALKSLEIEFARWCA